MNNPTSPQKLYIFTDGGADKSAAAQAGIGGFGFVVTDTQFKVLHTHSSDAYRWTSNDRMELMALRAALAFVEPPSDITIFYDLKGIGHWLGWEKPTWKRKENLDLWADIDAQIARHIRVTGEKVEAHRNPLSNPMNLPDIAMENHKINHNNKADELVNIAKKSPRILQDAVAEKKFPLPSNV